MPTEFSFEHTFRVPSTQTLIDAYFDADHLATQDVVGELCDRVVVESQDTDTLRQWSWRVTSQRHLPMIARPFVSGGRLSFVESQTWKRGTDVVDMTVVPQILGGRVNITGAYVLTKLAGDSVRRIYRGTITAAVKLLSGRIERGILDAFDEQMPAMAACTQGWLDRK